MLLTIISSVFHINYVAEGDDDDDDNGILCISYKIF